MGEAVRRRRSGPTETGAVNLGHDDGGLVADMLGKAEVLVGAAP